jgi:hypothetical protein
VKVGNGGKAETEEKWKAETGRKRRAKIEEKLKAES